MTIVRELTRRASLGLLGALATPWLARAQSNYPNRIIKLIVPYAAGGSSDVVARFIAERMRDRLGQSIVIENRPGAGAIVLPLDRHFAREAGSHAARRADTRSA
jgi:tripartite-type tricarboxylate transporter receptor subunit TctC